MTAKPDAPETPAQATPRARIRAAEDALAEIEARYGVRIVAIVETWPNGQQFPAWRIVDVQQKASADGDQSDPTRNRSE